MADELDPRTWRRTPIVCLPFLSLSSYRFLYTIKGVVTQPNITQYFIQHCVGWSRIYIRVSSKNLHPVYRPNGRTMGCIFDDSVENWPRYNGTALYLHICGIDEFVQIDWEPEWSSRHLQQFPAHRWTQKSWYLNLNLKKKLFLIMG